MPLRPACPGTEIARAPPLTTRARSSRSRVPRGKRSSRPTSSGAQGSRRSGGGLAPARRRAVALPASRVLSLGSALRGAALALLRCRERHDGSPAEARDSSGITSSGGHDLRRLSGNWRKRLKAVLGGQPTAEAGRRSPSFERVGGSCLFTGAGRPRARRTGSGTSGAGRRASTLRVAQKASARRRYGGGGGRRPTADGRRPTADGRRHTA